MTRFRLNAGKPAASLSRGGLTARSEQEAVDITANVDDWFPEKPVRIRQNNEIPPVPLTCGCTIPYPIITLLGSRPKKVECDKHGFQTIKKERKKKQCSSTQSPNQPSIPDPPPF